VGDREAQGKAGGLIFPDFISETAVAKTARISSA
jgi:hypothetical protein